MRTQSRLTSLIGLLGCASASYNSGNGGILVSRTVTSKPSYADANFTIQESGVCGGSDRHGSNDCTVVWGQNYSFNYPTVLTEDFTNGTASADLLVDGVLEYKPSCAVCGTFCTIEVPTILFNYSFYPGDCPVKVRNTNNTIHVTMPQSPGWSWWTASTKIAGSVTITNSTSATVGTGTINITATPAGATTSAPSAAA